MRHRRRKPGFAAGGDGAQMDPGAQARSLDELMERVQEVVELCLDVEGEEAEPLTFVGVADRDGT